MKKLFILIILASVLLVSGCTSQSSAKPSVSVLEAPHSVNNDNPFIVKWKVDGLGEITHTAIHYDYESRGEDFKLYREVSAIYTGSAPQEFSTNINALKPGFLFFRAHAIVGGNHYYSEERRIEVGAYDSVNKTKECPVCLGPSDWSECVDGEQNRQVYVCGEETNFLCQDRPERKNCTAEPIKPPEPKVQEFSVEASDSFFKPNLIEVSEGSTVRITFKAVSPLNWNGIDVRASNELFNTGTIRPNKEAIVEFTMPSENFTVTGYWPSSSIKKKTMEINVKTE